MAHFDKGSALHIVILSAVVYYVFFYKPTTFLREEPNDSYDYIIVGGGAAGCVLASRLSEDPQVSVLLMEAGISDDKNPNIAVPGKLGALRRSKQDWDYLTVPQNKSCKSLKNQQSLWPRGKALGGSGILNYEVYIRGNKKDYDDWEAMGATGWSYEKVLPYFKKSEDIQIPELRDSKYHGQGGPLVIENSLMNEELAEAFIKAGKELGYETGIDVNGESQLGLMKTQHNIKNGVRQSAMEAFLRPALLRSNLHVVVKAHVTKVNFEGNKAVGVTYIHENTKKTVKTNKEVILSAGAIGSPHILLLSGVGPKQQLEKLHIPVVADLPVGQNLKDHVGNYYPLYAIEKPVGPAPDDLQSWWSELRWRLFGKGPLKASGCDGVAFFKTDGGNTHPGMPDAECHFVTMAPQVQKDHFFADKFLGQSEEFKKKYDYDSIAGRRMFTWHCCVLKPKSTGELRLQSADPLDPPIIDPRYYEDESDLKVVIEALKFTVRMSESDTMKTMRARRHTKKCPGCEHLWDNEEKYFECVARSISATVYHPTTTCKMGSAKDPTTVVDPLLRVHKLKGIRVADASIMPDIVAGNTHAPTIMIAEKAADIIKGNID